MASSSSGADEEDSIQHDTATRIEQKHIGSHSWARDTTSSSNMIDILHLPVEVLRNIIAHIDQESDSMVNLDRRGYLSQESFKQPVPPTHQDRQDVGNFRLTCKLFGQLGAKHQFLRLTTRFGIGDFERLRGIASVPYLAENVRKFSYMIPCGFYHEKGKQILSPNFGFR